MGANQSLKNRHISGDDIAPSLNTAQYGNSPQKKLSDFDVINAPQTRRNRSNTLTQGQAVCPSPSSKLLPTVFKWNGKAKDVSLSGSFNGWKRKIPLTKSRNNFFTILDLPEGVHEYKFYVDGQWVLTPGEPVSPNGLGSQNNRIAVKKSDFEVFEALSLDSMSIEKCRRQCGVFADTGYGQETPAHPMDGKQESPPFLPPQLLQVILNKDIPSHYEPALLPEPNHVMLNHLYALSIKDGVMVLSATHRFRKKYVTTLLYRPI